MPQLRVKCVNILKRVLEEKIFFSDLKNQLEAKDLPYVNMLVLTSLRHWARVSAVVDRYLHKKIPHKHNIAEYLLKSAVCEIMYMETPIYAVVNETVKCVRQETDRFLAGMVNAVLRQIVNQKDKIADEMRKISPFPAEFKKILHGYDAEQIAEMAEIVEVQPNLDITVKENPLLWQQKLGGILLPNGTIRIESAEKVTQLTGYNEGQWWVQDAAASLPVQVIGDVSGKKVVDLCAAPGGKTAQLAALGADVTALDVSAERLKILQQNMARLGFNNVKTMAVDAINFLQNTAEKFDVILLDAPCSATGTWRRHPEVLHIKTMEDVKKQAAIQKQILALCHNVLNVGGILVYSVCSLSCEEGEKQIGEFLQTQKMFKLLPITEGKISAYGKWHDKFVAQNGTARTLPCYEKNSSGMDGFFICKMQRIN